MMEVASRCSHRLSVEDDRAGESFQYPSGGLMVDVQTIDELHAMQDEVSHTLTYAAPPTDNLPRFGDTRDIAARHAQKERRLSVNGILGIGTTDDDLLEIKDEVKQCLQHPPMYSPVIGELIVSLDAKNSAV